MRYLSERLPAERRAPPHILRGLRRIDPAADMIYLGEGEWWIGVMKPNQHRRRIGANIMAREWASAHPRWEQLRYAWCAVEGFAYCMTVHGEPTSVCVEEFREADWHYREARPWLEDALLEEPERMRMQNVRTYLKGRIQADIRANAKRLAGRRTLHTTQPVEARD